MASRVLTEQIDEYLEDLVPKREAELRKMEQYAGRIGFPIIGPTCGYFCYQIARMMGARHVFELGSGFGYSTAWFARAVQENGGGKVFHVVWDADLSARARTHLTTLGYAELIEYRIGEAVEALRETDQVFELIFIDIDKEAYPEALPVMAAKLRPGGVLLADNALWHGAVADRSDRSSTTRAVRRFTQMVMGDPAWVASIIPIRDGLLLAWKRA